MAELRWTCHLCIAEVVFADLDVVADHMAGHGLEVERWPDDSPVVVDTTLEPEEFTDG